jgi:tetratricopeptide (TPR) repeat protein
MTSRGAITVTASLALLIVLTGFTVADAGSRHTADNGNAAASGESRNAGASGGNGNATTAADNGNLTAAGDNSNAAADTGGATGNDQVCNATADYFLGAEDYREAIATHQRVLAAHPDDALAYYHLGFAFGMTGDRIDEIADYRKAAALGLRQWDLYLNLGRALLEANDYDAASTALITAVALAPERPESHFNLALAYERRGMFAVAQEQLQASLQLDPKQPDARNMMGLIYAEERDFSRARQIWNGLVRAEPDFEPARTNLAILDRMEHPSPAAPAPGGLDNLRTAFASDPY